MSGTDGVELSFSIRGLDFAAGGEAATRIKTALQHLGLAPELVRRAAIAAYEMEMNIIIHAHRGTLTARLRHDQIELEAVDQGPGISDIELAMQEGYSTAPDYIREMGFGAGMGLPNIKRCSDVLTIESKVGEGTRVLAVLLIR